MKSEFRSRHIHAEQEPAADIIEFSLPEQALITLHILDANGAPIEHVVENAVYPAGTHQIRCGNGRARTDRLYYRLCARADEWEIVDTKMISDGR